MKQQHGWLSLVTLCLVTALSSALGFGVLFAGTSVVFAVVQAPSAEAASQDPLPDSPVSGNPAAGDPFPAENPASASASQPQGSSGKEADQSGAASEKTFAGMITDLRCGARHSMNSDQTSAECARSCVRKGSRFVLVDGEESHGLDGDPTQLDRLAGVRVEVTGSLVGDTIKVKSVVAR